MSAFSFSKQCAHLNTDFTFGFNQIITYKLVIDVARLLQNFEIEHLCRFSEGVLPK